MRPNLRLAIALAAVAAGAYLLLTAEPRDAELTALVLVGR